MARLVLSFLGAFQALLDQRPIKRVRSTNNQGLLVYLALNSEKPISREVLATLFWPEDSENRARHNLRQALYRLRGILQDQSISDQPFLLVTRQTVQFNQNSDYLLDVKQFIEGIEANELETAVTHYQGDLLPGFTCAGEQFEDWLRLEREHLHQLALEAMSEAAGEQLQAGHYDRAQALARRQLSLEPWREQAYRQLMLAAALVGDRGNALAQFELCRQLLWDEIGVEPTPETVRLYEDIKAGRVGTVTGEATIHSPIKARHNLPAETTLFIGREGELAAVRRMIIHDQRRLLTILGPGGIGKTRLALAAGSALLDHFQDGVFFVDLAPVTDGEDIAAAAAAAFNYQAPDKTQKLLPQLLDTLKRQNLLLILDNFEQVGDGAGIVNMLLQACPDLTLLVTSRQQLNLAGETRFQLAGLDFPDLLTVEDALTYTAVQLFVDNGRRIRPEYELTEANVVYVLHICRLVQGMPLALILAAAWLELLTTAEIAIEIEKSLGFLAVDLADLPARQRSMRAVFERSWQRMEPKEQSVLARLSVFRGGFSRDAAEQVAGANLRILLSLANKSLLRRRPENGRFALHELLRQYAAEQLVFMATTGSTHLAHSRYFAGLVPPEMRRALFYLPLLLPQRYAADRDNFRHAWAFALEYGLAHELANMAGGMVILSITQGIQPADITGAALQAVRRHGVPETDRPVLHLRLVDLSARQVVDDFILLQERCEKFAAILEQHDYPDLRYWLYVQLAMIARENRDAQYMAWIKKAYETACAMKEERLINAAAALRLWLTIEAGQVDHEQQLQLKELLDYFEPQLPDSFVTYCILLSLSMSSAEMSAYEEAFHYGKRALNIAKSWRELYWISSSDERLARAYLRQNLPQEAGWQLLDSLEWHSAIGQNWQMLGFIGGAALMYPQLVGGQEVAIELLSLVYHHPDLVDNHRRKIKTHSARLQAELGPEASAAAWERGKMLELETAVDQLRAAWT